MVPAFITLVLFSIFTASSLFYVRVSEMCKGEAGDAGWWDGETGVVWGAGPAGLQHAPYCRRRRGKTRRCRWGHNIWYGVFILLGQEGRCGGREVIIPLKTTTLFISGAFRVGKPVQVAGSGHWAAELWCLTVWAGGVVTQFLGGGLLVKQVDSDIVKERHCSSGVICAAPRRKWGSRCLDVQRGGFQQALQVLCSTVIWDNKWNCMHGIVLALWAGAV